MNILPQIDPESWLEIAIARYQTRRTRMLILRDSSGTPSGKAAWETAVREYEVEERIAVEQSRARSNPDVARGLLLTLACKLRDGDSLSFAARCFLFEALTGAAARPNEAAQQLGLKRPHGAQTSREVEARNVALAFAVHELRGSYPLSSGVDSAIGQVSASMKIGESTVRDAYEQFRHYAEFAEQWKAQQRTDNSASDSESNTG